MTQNDLKGFRFRESTRAPFDTEVKLRFDRFGGAVSGFSADISMEGMFVRTAEPKPVGTLVQFEFGLGADGELIQGLGDVVWVRTRQLAPNKPPGMGIQFRYIDPHSRELIFKIVDKFLKETKQDGTVAGAEATPPAPEEPGPPVTAAAPAPPASPSSPMPAAAAPSPSAPAPSVPPAAGPPGQVDPGQTQTPAPASAPASSSLAGPEAAAAGPAAPSPPLPSPPAPVRPAPPSPGSSTPTVGDEAFSFALPSLETEGEKQLSSPTPSPAAPRQQAKGELFVPDEMWDPVSAAAQAVASDSFTGPPSRPAYAGSAGVARQSSGSRRWLLVLLLLLVAAAVAAFVFRDRLSDLLPGGGEVAQEVPAAPDLDQTVEGGVVDALPADEDVVAADAAGEEVPERPPEDAQAVPGGTPGDALDVGETVLEDSQPLAGATPSRVEEIRSWQRVGETLITIEGDGSFREGDYSELRLENPPRLLVKLFGIGEEYLAVTRVASPELRQIRTALHGGNELHVVLDLAAGDVRSTVTVEDGRLRIRLER